MSVIINICGVLIATSNFPDPTLRSFYQDYYHCKIEPTEDESSYEIQHTETIYHLFPKNATWWPIFTSDQLDSESYKNIVRHGINPGVILPNDYFSFIEYFKIKKAVNEGAIPIALYQMKTPKYFAAKATFSTAIGLRPLGAMIETGWDQNIISQPAGNYFIQSKNSNDLNVPARVIQYKQQFFYNTTIDPTQSSGYQIILNPPLNMSVNNIQYPNLGISWKIHNTNYRSTTEGIETNLLGYVFIVLSIVVIPLDYIFSAHYPSLLSTFGSSISWISLLFGGILLLILIISIIRRRRINARN
ncbi:hypothetical protein [Acinetobacter beijerinckii]|uniref:hypothetical protein n=1 Tax=Acinetobacter beijerinckii TaxID=262668 RepID=UPI003AF9C788